MSERDPSDDESASQYQHDLPRVSGGGRKLHAEFNYECLWCPKEVLKLGQKGKFRELKTYRRHFMNFHHGENGEGVPMADFLMRVQRNEPTWFCEICQQDYSLDNEIRHRAICKPNQEKSDSDNNISLANKNQPKQKTKKSIKVSRFKRIKSAYLSDSSSSSNDDEPIEASVKEHRQGNTDPKRQILDRSIDTSFEPRDKFQKTGNERSMLKNNPEQLSESRNISVLDHCSEPIPNPLCQNKGVDGIFSEIKDEICLSDSGPEDDITKSPTQLIVKLETEEEEEEENIIKWWLHVPKHLYTDMNKGGPKIFLPTEEFVELCLQRHREATQEKLILDQIMMEKESPEEELLQFSDLRDKPILDNYTAFVKTLSTKDILQAFSEEYEELDIPKGVKSSTAGQYGNRIIEFFKFMAKRYPGFHLDWFFDYKEEIEKIYPDGTKTNEMFIPRKDDVTDFIKQFKYGGKHNNILGVDLISFFSRKSSSQLWDQNFCLEKTVRFSFK